MILFLIVPCILCFIYAWRRRQKYLEGKLPPVNSGAWPIIGHAHLWLRGLFWPRLLDMQRDCLDQGGITYLYSGYNPAYAYYAVANPNDCAKVANSCLEKFFLLDDTVKALLGEGLSTVSSVQVWEDRRKFLGPIFDEISANLAVHNQQAKLLQEALSEKLGKGFFDQTEYLQDVTMRILLSTVYGDTEEAELRSYKVTLQEISDVLFDRHQSFLKHKKLFFRWSKLKRRQDQCARTIKAYTNEIITRKRMEFNKDAGSIYGCLPTGSTVAERRNGEILTNRIVHGAGFLCNPIEPQTFLDHLFHLEDEGVYFEQTMVDEINGILFGGYNTIVNSLNFILVMIGSHPVIQECINTEIQNILGDSSREITMEDLNNFSYLHAVIIEVLRLYPVVTTVSRKAQSCIELQKYTIEPGTNCLLFIRGMNRHPSWGPDRDEFKPERWLSGTTKEIATFSLGRRSCIGMNLALNNMKIILIYMLKNYKIAADHTELQTKHELMFKPISGHHICLEKR